MKRRGKQCYSSYTHLNDAVFPQLRVRTNGIKYIPALQWDSLFNNIMCIGRDQMRLLCSWWTASGWALLMVNCTRLSAAHGEMHQVQRCSWWTASGSALLMVNCIRFSAAHGELHQVQCCSLWTASGSALLMVNCIRFSAAHGELHQVQRCSWWTTLVVVVVALGTDW